MLVSDALKFFSGQDGDCGAQTRLANALKITRGAVSQWGDVVPEGNAYKLESLTKGKLKADPKLYEKH